MDANVKILLNIAEFRSFASIKSIESVDEIYEVIERRVRTIKYRSPERQLLKALLRKHKIEQFTLSTPHRSEIKTIFNQIQTMDVKDFADISSPPNTAIKSEHSGDIQGILLHRLHFLIEKWLGDTAQEVVDFKLLKQPPEIGQQVEKWTMICPLAGCDMKIKIAYDHEKVHVRSTGYERHLRSVHPNKEDLVLKSKVEIDLLCAFDELMF